MRKRVGVSIEVDATNDRIAAATVNDYTVKDLPLGTALSVLLRQHDLAYAANGQDIIVASPARAQYKNPAKLSVVPVEQIVKH